MLDEAMTGCLRQTYSGKHHPFFPTSRMRSQPAGARTFLRQDRRAEAAGEESGVAKKDYYPRLCNDERPFATLRPNVAGGVCAFPDDTSAPARVGRVSPETKEERRLYI